MTRNTVERWPRDAFWRFYTFCFHKYCDADTTLSMEFWLTTARTALFISGEYGELGMNI